MPKLVQKRLDEGRAVRDLSEVHGRRRLVWADDHASLYAALPEGRMEIKTYFYDMEGAEIAHRTSRGTRFVTLGVCDQDKWPRVTRIVTTTPEGRTVRDIEIGRRDQNGRGPVAPLAVHGSGPRGEVRRP